MRFLPLFIFSLLLWTACGNQDTTPPSGNTPDVPAVEDNITNISYEITGYLPHDVSSFTEGLLFHENQLFESTGSPDNLPLTRSVLGTVDTATGKINVKAELNRNIYFGEGMVILNGKIYQLTYQNKVCFYYDAKTYKQLGFFKYDNKEGWGMTTDGTHLIMSDGSNVLTYVNPVDFKPVKTVAVTRNNIPMEFLNELEYINGFIYANVWTTGYIVKIDPATGKVTGVLNLDPLVQEARARNRESLEMNGIAYNPVTKKIYVTGKMWPFIAQLNFSH